MRPIGLKAVERYSSSLRIETIVRLRWIAVAGQLATVVIVYWGFGFDFPVIPCLMMIALSAALNIILSVSFSATERLRSSFASNMLVYDTIQLAALLFLTGGLQNPFAFLMVVPVTVAAATQPPQITVSLGSLAGAIATALVFIRMPLPWYPGESFELPVTYVIGIWAAVISSIIFLSLYCWRIAKEAQQMSDALVATESILAREQRLSALDGMAAAAAHELGTPLATISVVTKELMRALPKDSPQADDIALLRSQAERCREILTTLTRQSGENDPMHANARLSVLLEEVVEPYRVFGPEISISVKPARGSSGQANRNEPISPRNPAVLFGLGNLVENAVDFAESSVQIDAMWDKNRIRLSIADDGPGIQPSVLMRLGEPYVTSRAAGQNGDGANDEEFGLGLGFFIAKTLLERSGAEVELRNRQKPQSGAIARVTWPRDAMDIDTAGAKVQ